MNQGIRKKAEEDRVMCESVLKKSHGWKGWRGLPAPKVSGALGAFIDLSHRITEELSRIPSFPQPRIRQITTIPQHRANVTEVQMVVHHGTHLDAPRHFIADGPTIDQIPLERLYGPGVIWRIDVADCGLIDVADLELATPRMQEGDIVLLDTGRARYINTEKYMNHASLTAEAADWLVKRGAKIVGVDFATPDLAAAGFRLSGALHTAQPWRIDCRTCDQSRQPGRAARRDHVLGPQCGRL